MKSSVLLSVVCSLLGFVSVVAAAPPTLWVPDGYTYDRRAVNHDFDQREAELRRDYKAVRQQEEDAWRQARRAAPPQARRSINQQYAQRRRALALDYVARRKALEQLEDQTRAAVNSNVRYSTLYPLQPPGQLQPEYRAAPLRSPETWYEELPPPARAPFAPTPAPAPSGPRDF